MQNVRIAIRHGVKPFQKGLTPCLIAIAEDSWTYEIFLTPLHSGTPPGNRSIFLFKLS